MVSACLDWRLRLHYLNLSFCSSQVFWLADAAKAQAWQWYSMTLASMAYRDDGSLVSFGCQAAGETSV